MTKQISEEMRDQIAPFVTIALERAIITYLLYSDRNIGTEEFKEYHVSGKAALAHIILILKLAEMVGLTEPETDGEERQEVLKALIEAGQKQVDDYEKNS